MTGGTLVAFAGGGSGGHLYPSLAVADAIRTLAPDARFVFFGTGRSIDADVLCAYDAQFVRQPVRPLPSKVWHWPAFLIAWRNSTRACREFFSKHRPVAVVGSGGYASAPSIFEAARAGIPAVLLNPDAVPGKANRALQSRVDAVFTQWPDTREHFRRADLVQVTGCPVRPEFKQARRSDGIEHFGLDPDKRVLLVTGASQGARSINQAVIAAVPVLAETGTWDRWQLLHLTGNNDQAEAEAAYREHGVAARVVGYSKHMALALAAADLVVSRAGASTLAEITALGRPSVLMPYPYHKDQHQVANARMLVKAGAARMVPDQIDPAVNAPALANVLGRLVNREQELTRLAAAARRMGTTSAASDIARHLLGLNGNQPSTEQAESMEEMCCASR